MPSGAIGGGPIGGEAIAAAPSTAGGAPTAQLAGPFVKVPKYHVKVLNGQTGHPNWADFCRPLRLTQPALRSGLPRVAAALRPGGWLIVGHGKFGGTPVQDALTRFKTLAYGGTPLDESAACHLLRDAGLTSVRPVPTPAGAPAITIGQKPA